MTRSIFSITCLLIGYGAVAQSSTKLPENWHLQDHVVAGYYGISAEAAWNGVLKSKSSTPVVVAIIDSGTETFHPDLVANIWVNKGEIEGNGIDDDKNGYIDDVHGWSFIGGKNGDVQYDNLEFTRKYKTYKNKFAGRKSESLSDSEKKEYEEYLSLDKEYKERLSTTQEEKAQFEQVVGIYKMANESFTKELGPGYTVEDLESFKTDNEFLKGLKDFMILAMEEDLAGGIEEGMEHFENSIKYSYNLDFDPRSIVGDDYNNPREKNYGNNHIDGPEAEHGTHVAGIVGATHNGFGVNGICPNAQLMILRCVPNGDERDKDVANSIRYAADNGARVINMSFGKSISPYKEVVDEAVKYAESKGVLLIHASGNDGKNIDKRNNFPNCYYGDGKRCTTWIEVGASGPTSSELIADFSNYGKKKVDVFAPGVDIYSTMTGSSYKRESGTSMASPVVTGVAALIMSYYPELTAQEVKKIILKSSVKPKVKVITPGEEGKPATLKKLSVTGGIVNVNNAVNMAEKMK